MFPSSDSVIRRPLPSTGSRRVRFPGFSGTMERCDSLRTVTAGFLIVRRPLPRRCACLRHSTQARRRPGARSIAVRLPRRRHAGGVAGRPKFLGNPPVPMPCSPTPAGSDPPGLTVVRRGPRSTNAEGYPRVCQSRGSIARPQHALSTLRPGPCRTGRKTRFWLPARLYQVGLVTHRVPSKGFGDVLVYIRPPFPGLSWRNGTVGTRSIIEDCATNATVGDTNPTR
jgi:hypothetical protein